MKTKQQRLSTSFCQPTVEEWNNTFKNLPAKGKYVYADWGDRPHAHHCIKSVNDKEIPTVQFNDLVNDSIAGWRMVEDGFEDRSYESFKEFRFTLNESEGHYIEVRGCVSLLTDGCVSLLVNGERIKSNATTYTEIIALYNLFG